MMAKLLKENSHEEFKKLLSEIADFLDCPVEIEEVYDIRGEFVAHILGKFVLGQAIFGVREFDNDNKIRVHCADRPEWSETQASYYGSLRFFVVTHKPTVSAI